MGLPTATNQWQEGLKPSARTEYTQAQPCVSRVFFRAKGARAGLRSMSSGGDLLDLSGAPSWVKSAGSTSQSSSSESSGTGPMLSRKAPRTPPCARGFSMTVSPVLSIIGSRCRRLGNLTRYVSFRADLEGGLEVGAGGQRLTPADQGKAQYLILRFSVSSRCAQYISGVIVHLGGS